MYGANDSQNTSSSSREPAAAQLVQSKDGQLVVKRRNSAQRLPEVEKLVVVNVRDVEQASPPTAKEEVTWMVYVLAACASVNSINLGFACGIVTNAGPLVRRDLNLTLDGYEVFMGMMNITAIIGAVFGSQFADMVGRRMVFLLSSFVFLIGHGMVILSPNLTILLLGRGVTGLGLGCGFCIDPMYISEIAPPLSRGWLVTWSEIATNVGILLGFVVGWLLSSDASPSDASPGTWRIMFAYGLSIPFLMFFLAWNVMMESPRWLVQQNRLDEAREVLEAIFPEGADVPEIVNEIQESLVHDQQAYDTHSWSSIFCPKEGLAFMLLVGIGAVLSQQFVGMDIMVLYMQDIMWDAGPLFDQLGRRPMMLMSLLACAAVYFTLGGVFLAGWQFPEAVGVLMGSFFAFVSLGVAPGGWLLPSELLSTSVRAKGISVGAACNRAVAAGSGLFTLSIVSAIGWGALFMALGTVCVLFMLFFYFLLPETKGKTLEEIAIFFADMAATKPEASSIDAKALIEE